MRRLHHGHQQQPGQGAGSVVHATAPTAARPRARRVPGLTTPSTGSMDRAWNAITACRVAGPNAPSGFSMGLGRVVGRRVQPALQAFHLQAATALAFRAGPEESVADEAGRHRRMRVLPRSTLRRACGRRNDGDRRNPLHHGSLLFGTSYAQEQERRGGIALRRWSGPGAGCGGAAPVAPGDRPVHRGERAQPAATIPGTGRTAGVQVVDHVEQREPRILREAVEAGVDVRQRRVIAGHVTIDQADRRVERHPKIGHGLVEQGTVLLPGRDGLPRRGADRHRRPCLLLLPRRSPCVCSRRGRGRGLTQPRHPAASFRSRSSRCPRRRDTSTGPAFPTGPDRPGCGSAGTARLLACCAVPFSQA